MTPLPLADTIPPAKVCGCALAFSEEAWAALPLVSEGKGERGIFDVLELRNCSCGSTLAREPR